MRTSDQMLARYTGEIEERQQLIDGLVEKAETDQRDLNEQEMELVTRARDRIKTVNDLIDPLVEARRISTESSERIAAIAKFMGEREEPPKAMEYRSAGAYVLDRWKAGIGGEDALARLELYHRTAAHQTTSDNPGLLPAQIMGPVVNFVDQTRPLTSALGARDLPSGAWNRPIIAQHAQVTEQSSEKTELASRKMTINNLPVAAKTYGGYLNVSRQDIDWTQPQVMDIVINDLAGQYAIVTEAALADQVMDDAKTGTTYPATPDAADIAGAVWKAAGAVFTAVNGAGRLIIACAPDMLGLVGPLFAPVNPQNAQSTGFSAGSFGTGAVGAISGISVVMSAGLAPGSLVVLSSAAVEVYEDRVGALQVVEPSVLGVQVAYAGYFAALTVEDDGIQSITQAGG